MLWLEEALLGLLLFGDNNNNDAVTAVTCASFASPRVDPVALGKVSVSVAR